MSNSTAEVEADVTKEADKNVCANCGIAGLDNNELEECTACQSVQYCSDKCREEHREQHDEECENQAVKSYDKNLFSQPDSSHFGECPICFLPMPIDPTKSMIWTCCSKLICKGCDYVNDRSNGGIICPFCREPVVRDDEECRKMLMKRIKANDPAALCQMGGTCYDESDYDGAFDYWTKAAELGNVDAHAKLGIMYATLKDEEKSIYHYEKAAIGGHPIARHILGRTEMENDKIDRAVKHFTIAANLGDEDSMKELWGMFKQGHINKDDLAATLRAHHAAVDAMKSAHRDAAEADASSDE
jgi:TPR repeat protein